MEKMLWTKPEMNEIIFEPEEYVSVCWGVQCDVEKANEWEKTHYTQNAYGQWISWFDLNRGGTSTAHSSPHCGSASNQVIYDYNNDNIADKMIEIGTDGLGNLECEIWTNDTFEVRESIANVQPNTDIYWTTSVGNKIWHHIGRVFETFAGHPNRS